VESAGFKSSSLPWVTRTTYLGTECYCRRDFTFTGSERGSQLDGCAGIGHLEINRRSETLE
jgi:hypothetical protein